MVSLAGDQGSVDARIAEAASESDVVLDYLWGEPAAQAMMAILRKRRDRGKPIDWVQIGSVAGPTMDLPSVALRSTNIRLMGSGQGSVPLAQIVAELPRIADAVATGRIAVERPAGPAGGGRAGRGPRRCLLDSVSSSSPDTRSASARSSRGGRGDLRQSLGERSGGIVGADRPRARR